MVTTITLIFFVSKLCHLASSALIDPNLVHPTTIDPNSVLSAYSSAATHFIQPDNNQRRPEIDSLLQNRHIMRDKRNVKRGEKNFVRLGRDGEEYSRYARAEKNLIRFGRNDNSKGNGFIRLGRSDKGLIRFGRNDNSDAMRFGRRGDKFIRFGRNNGGLGNIKSKDSSFVANDLNADNSLQLSRPIYRPGRADKYIRFGRGDNGFIRLGKKDEEFKFKQEQTPSAEFDSEEKEESAIAGEDDGSVPMQLYYMLQKGTELPAGIDFENNMSPGTPSLDDDYQMNVKLNYDKNSLKNNLL